MLIFVDGTNLHIPHLEHRDNTKNGSSGGCSKKYILSVSLHKHAEQKLKWNGVVVLHEKHKWWNTAAHDALTVTTLAQGQRVHQSTPRRFV